MNRHDRHLAKIQDDMPARPARLAFPGSTFAAVRACRKLTRRLVRTDYLNGVTTFERVLERATAATLARFEVDSAQFFVCERWCSFPPMRPDYRVTFS
jgi:hypothetical protein